MKRLIVAVLLIFAWATSGLAITELDATKPNSNSALSTYGGYAREERAKINEIIAAIPGAADWSACTVSCTAVNGDKLMVDTSASTAQITMPASPTAGQHVTLIDAKGTWGTNAVTLLGNSSKIAGSASNYTLSHSGIVTLTYYNAGYGWAVGWFDPANPGPIGSTTPSTGAFTSLNATSVRAGSITDTGLTASKPVVTDSVKQLASGSYATNATAIAETSTTDFITPGTLGAWFTNMWNRVGSTISYLAGPLNGTYYVSTYAGLTAALASSANDIEIIAPITITANTVFTKPVKVHYGAVITHGAYTLVFNKTFSAGHYQTFCGTGLVSFSLGAVYEVLAAWYYSISTDCGCSPDWTTAICAAVMSAASTGGAEVLASNPFLYAMTGGGSSSIYGTPVVLPAGTFEVANIYLKKNVPIIGVGAGATVLKIASTTTGAFIIPLEDLYDSTNPEYGVVLQDLTIDGAANNHTLDFLYSNYYFNDRIINRVAFIGNPDVSHRAIHIYHTSDAGLPNYMYHNIIQNCTFTSFKAAEVIWFDGDSASSRRCNDNYILNNVFTDYKVAVRIEGTHNKVSQNTFNANDDPVLLAGGGTNFRLIFTASLYGSDYQNVVAGNWFEGGADEVLIFSEGLGGGSGPNLYAIDASTTNEMLYLDAQVIDIAQNRKYAATRTGSTTFTVVGDYTTYFQPNRKVELYQGTDGWYATTILHSTYSAPDTTVTVNDSVVATSLAYAYLGDDDGKFRVQLPWHTADFSCDTFALGSYVHSAKDNLYSYTSDNSTRQIYNIPISEGQTISVRAYVTGASTADRGNYGIGGLFYRATAGNCTQQGSTVNLYNATESNATWTGPSFDTSAANIQVKVTGMPSTVIKWRARVDYEVVE